MVSLAVFHESSLCLRAVIGLATSLGWERQSGRLQYSSHARSVTRRREQQDFWMAVSTAPLPCEAASQPQPLRVRQVALQLTSRSRARSALGVTVVSLVCTVQELVHNTYRDQDRSFLENSRDAAPRRASSSRPTSTAPTPKDAAAQQPVERQLHDALAEVLALRVRNL